MTDIQFKNAARRRLEEFGADQIKVSTAIDTDAVAVKLMGVSCRFRGQAYEMTVTRGAHDDRSKQMILDAISRMPTETAEGSNGVQP